VGKPYAQELSRLKRTYAWSRNASIEGLIYTLAHISCSPLLVVGSGGSLSAAYFAASLHEQHTGEFAKAATPLEAIDIIRDLRDPAVILLSAGGRNPDVIGALKRIIVREPARLIVICAKGNSPLVETAKKYSNIDIINFDFPFGRDGFLATNSLLAYQLLLARGYYKAYSNVEILPREFECLLNDSTTVSEFRSKLQHLSHSLWSRPNLIVLYGMVTYSAALDLESKFTEAALSAVQLSDYRNFAHGRHLWLAKRGDETGIVAFVSKEDRSVAEKTLRLLPPEIPTARIEVPGERPLASLAALVATLFLVGLAGEAKGVDPGRPGVPLFGRKIYNLRAFPSQRSSSLETRALNRKLGSQVLSVLNPEELDYWSKAFRSFVERLTGARFGALVCDYDGTLCDERNRFLSLSAETVAHLRHLLKIGLKLGIATGRGRSVKEVLRECLPKKLWKQVLIGYYNGAEIGFLGDDKSPAISQVVEDSLAPVARSLRENITIQNLCECTYRSKQITLVPKRPASRRIIWHTALELTRSLDWQGINVLQSSHSIDITAPGVTKRRLIEKVRENLHSENAILCIGDKGQFPGNDFDLLSEPFSLTVDQCSIDPSTCWNLTPRGYRGAQGANYYLASLAKSDKATMRFVSPMT
jgi:fructoselysine-6-P-deglycase FrlB-like protein